MKEERGGLLAILLVLLAGLFVGTGPGPTDSKRSAPTSEPPSVAALSGTCTESLERVVEHLTSARNRTRDPADTETDFLSDLRMRLDNEMYPVEFLIASVPDPIDSTSGWRFDERVAAVKRAVEHSGHVFDRFWLPWQCDVVPKGAKGSEHRRRPGVLVFRGTYHVLVVFLVGETPTWGVQQEAMRYVLDTVDKWRAPRDARGCAEWVDRCDDVEDPFGLLSCKQYPELNRVIRIVAPTFSGSMTSIRQVLKGWIGSRDGARSDAEKSCGHTVAIELVSGSATNSRLNDLLTMGTSARFRNSVRLRTTILPDYALVTGFANYLKYIGQESSKGVFLTESGTAYGQLLSSCLQTQELCGSESFKRWRILPFPLHIASLRDALQAADSKKGKSEAIRGQGPLVDLPLGSTGDAIDILPALQPTMSRSAAELALGNILSSIARDGVTHVGLFATDVRDKLFLSRMVKKYAPGVSLFAFEADLLYSHPSYRDSVEGMLVVSTYPLYAPNQIWTSPPPPDSAPIQRLLQMSSDGAQGTYNATLVQLGEMHEDLTHLEKQDVTVPPPLEYGVPFDDGSRYPPVWISAVGRGGVWPVWIYEPETLPDHVYHKQPGDTVDPPALLRSVDNLGSAWRTFTILMVASVLLIAACLLPFGGWGPKSVRNWAWFRPRHCPVCRYRQGRYLLVLFVILASSAVLFFRPYPRYLELGWFFAFALLLAAIVAVPLVVFLVFIERTDTRRRGRMHCRHPKGPRLTYFRFMTLKERRFTSNAFLAFFLISYAFFIAWVVISEMIGLSTPDQYFLLHRAGDLSSGLSPLAPIAFVTAGAVWWGLLNLYRLDLLERAMPAAPESPESATAPLFSAIRQAIEAPLRSAPLSRIAAVLVFLWVLPLYVMAPDLRAVLEGRFLGRVAVFLIVGGYGAMLAFAYAYQFFLWRRVLRFLRYIEAGWTREAFARLSNKLPTAALRGLWAKPFNAANLDNFVRVAVAAEPPRDIVEQASTEKRDKIQKLVNAIESAAEALPKDVRRAGESSDWDDFATTRTQRSLTKSAKAAAAALAAFRAGDGLKPIADEEVSTEALEKWAQAMRDLLASQYVAVLSPVLIFMRHLSMFLVGASLLFLLSVTSYPVQPSNLLRLHGFTWLLLSIALAMVISFRTKRHDVMRELAGGAAGAGGWFDVNNIGSFVTYVLLPLLGVFASQSPEFAKLLDQILRIFG